MVATLFILKGRLHQLNYAHIMYYLTTPSQEYMGL